jgi:uncharacterized ion transporter superfamily protein YfcC
MAKEVTDKMLLLIIGCILDILTSLGAIGCIIYTIINAHHAKHDWYYFDDEI